MNSRTTRTALWMLRQGIRVIGILAGGAAGVVVAFAACARFAAPEPCPSPCDGPMYVALGAAMFIGLPAGLAAGFYGTRWLARRLT